MKSARAVVGEITGAVASLPPHRTRRVGRAARRRARARGLRVSRLPAENKHEIIGGHSLTRHKLQAILCVGHTGDCCRTADTPGRILRSKPLVESSIRLGGVRTVDHERTVDAQHAFGCEQTRRACEKSLGNGVRRNVTHVAAVCSRGTKETHTSSERMTCVVTWIGASFLFGARSLVLRSQLTHRLHPTCWSRRAQAMIVGRHREQSALARWLFLQSMLRWRQRPETGRHRLAPPGPHCRQRIPSAGR